MAKTRVYELARDLNMTNKVLLDKLTNLDISVKSHMSALDDDVVVKVKTALFGRKEEAVEETRIKPTVIRRRRKKISVDAVPESAVETDEIAAAEKPAEEAPPLEEAVEAPKEIGVAEELPEAEEKPQRLISEVEEASAGEGKAPIVLKETKPKRPAKKVKKEAAAKIIKMPVKPPEEPPVEEPAEVEVAKAKVTKLPIRKPLAPEI
jgi:translation initiation factor IF-2